ncbi:hypothetical protein KUL49_34730 [Alteromonas sp. KUL49]|nr:hypothetical protein KUL49_34730 [Alteromonas sp. KUL49]
MRFEELGSLYRILDNFSRINEKSEIDLPLIVSYSVNRTNIKSNKTFDLEKITPVNKSSKYDAYDINQLMVLGTLMTFLNGF